MPEGPGASSTALSQFSQSPYPYPQSGLAPRCLCADQWDWSQMLSKGSGASAKEPAAEGTGGVGSGGEERVAELS